MSDAEADAYASGLHASLLIKELFRDFWTEHVAPKPVHPGTLAGVMSAFYQLVVAESDFYYWDGIPYDVERNLDTPLEHLEWCASQQGEDALRVFGQTAEYMREFVRYPPLMFYGIGINDHLDGESQELPSLLTLTLWHLFSQTGSSLGQHIQQMFTLGMGQDHDDFEQVRRLKPLPKDTDVLELFRHVHLAGFVISEQISHGEILAYALGETNNPLANATNYELETIYSGDSGYGWYEFEDFAALSIEARNLSIAYNHLEVQCAKIKDCIRLVRQVRRGAAAARRKKESAQGQPLIETLGGLEPEQEQLTLEVEQW